MLEEVKAREDWTGLQQRMELCDGEGGKERKKNTQ